MKPRTVILVSVGLLAALAIFFWWQRSSTIQNPDSDLTGTVGVEQEPAISEELTELLETSDLSDPAVRERIAGQVKAREEAIREAAHARARQLGITTREVLDDGTIIELQGFDDDGPIYYSTMNVDAAISSGASQIRGQAAPYDLDGFGVRVGVWDGGVAGGHKEFSHGGVETKDKVSSQDHPTHVIGTITADGIDSKAKGMAPESEVESYDWNFDISEMLLAGAGSATESDKLSISNHSYGIMAGYEQFKYWCGAKIRDEDWGTGRKPIEEKFGRYSDRSKVIDTVAFSLPYLTSFFAAANDRDHNPEPRDWIQYLDGTGTFEKGDMQKKTEGGFIYDDDESPLGDGKYRNGFENIRGAGIAKNVITVGAVKDAVSGGSRSLEGAIMTDFSSWGPTDDGRIKPDIVANGFEVYSPISDGWSKYASDSGTSMAAPSATGSAALLAELYQNEFKKLMPSSLMKALLIHTADDLGTPGPDYSNGWGLINVKAAADIILAHKKHVDKTDPKADAKLIEGAILADKVPFTHRFLSDGSTPIRVTLCWTDPAGPEQGSDSRTSVLSHNLDLVITGPNGEVHEPYKMPYVGDWSLAKLEAGAIRGKNDTDNVEHVFDRAKPTLDGPGLYQVTVSLDGSLKKTIARQNFSLVVTGGIALPKGKAAIELDESLGFGEVAVGRGRTVNLQIRNVGDADLNVSGIDFSGNEEMSGSFSGVIKAGASEPVAVTYTPVTAVEGLHPWFGTLSVLSDAAAGRTTVPLGRVVPGIDNDAPKLRLPPQGVAFETNYIDELVDSEWSYDWEGESYTNRFAFNADWTVRIIVVDNPNYRTSDIQAGYSWRPIGPNQIAITGPGKSEFSSDAINLKFTSASSFETTSLGGKAIQGRRYGEAKIPVSYTEGLAGMVFNYLYWKRKGNTVTDFSTTYEPVFGQFLADGKIKPYLRDDIHGVWDNVTWNVHAKNVVRLSNASTGKQIYLHFVAPRRDPGYPDRGHKPCVATGWEGNNMMGYFVVPKAAKDPAKDLTERQERPITGNFGGIEMVWCLPGDFDMGSPETETGRQPHESSHRVTLTRGFWIAKTETTQEQWKMVMGTSHGQFSGTNLPVEQVSWDDAQAWCTKMNELHPLPAGTEWGLPTEAQWEYACRAGTSGPYAGASLDALAWYDGTSGNTLQPVATKSANAWGLHDMHGNVSEWCADGYTEAYPVGPVKDPRGAVGADGFRVLRGGAWESPDFGCRSASRFKFSPGTKQMNIGFRAAIVATE